jgi:flagellar basal body-associated protein FliL
VDLKGPFKNLLKKVFKKSSKKGSKKKPKKLSKKKLIIISMVVFIILLGSGLMFFLKSGNDETTANKDPITENILINSIEYDNILVLKKFTWINLKDSSHMKQVSISIALELTSKEEIDIVDAKRDIIRTLVRRMIKDMRWIKLRSPEGKIEFKYALIRKINLLFPDIVIRNLYLTHFIMR